MLTLLEIYNTEFKRTFRGYSEEEVKLNTKKQTEIIEKEARIRSQKMLEEATLKSHRLNAEHKELQKQMHVYRDRMRSLIKSQLDILDESQIDED